MSVKNVLLVEDNLTIQEVEKMQLERLGFQVTVASDGLDALEIFQNNPEHFSLIFTDLQMPHMDGDELALQIHQINPQVPIILVTGKAKVETQYLANFGIQAIMHKPYEHSQLVREIDNVMN